MSEIDNGPVDQWNKQKMARDKDGNLLYTENAKLALDYFDTYIKNYIKYIKVIDRLEKNELAGDDGAFIKVYLSDGSTLYMNNGDCFCFLYDVNGDKSPNKHGKDIFNFLLCSDNGLKTYFLGENNSNLGPRTGGKYSQDREVVLSRCKNDSRFCSRLLMFDGWEFKSDYPHKL